jgi:hypothetical protein
VKRFKKEREAGMVLKEIASEGRGKREFSFFCYSYSIAGTTPFVLTQQ